MATDHFFSRNDRVADAIRKSLSLIIQKDMRDPRVSMVSITEVALSKDLSFAKIYLTILNCEDAKAAKEPIKVLNNAAGFLRSALAQSISLRQIPSLRFYFDESLIRANRIDQLLNTIPKKDTKDLNGD